MKKTILFLFLFIISFASFGQINGGQLPISWVQQIDTRMSPIELPPLDLYQVYQEDLVNDLDKSLPWRYGVNREIQLDLVEDGIVTALPNGGELWQIAIRSPNAINLSLNFDEFFLPQGATLHFFNDDRSDLSKTHSNSDNRPNQNFGSWFINGDIIWVEYYHPPNTVEQPKLNINSLIHGYRLGQVNQYVDGIRGLNDSGDCNYDVNCEIGEDFDPKKDIVKKAVALLNLGNGYLCSAVLINNTNLDKTPYLLTGNHCLDNSDPSFWSVRFNWVSPVPVCATGEESIDVQSNFTMSGADLRAKNELSDFALVELFNDIPNSWDVAFAGWDKTDTPPQYAVGIHHPNGDIMKVCRDDTGAVKENAAGTEVWLIKGISAGNGDGWEIGTTESGSSGSPLFDQNGRIIGQLYAGQSFCDGLQNNGDYDIYGRFAVSWDAGGTQATQLMDWLDPIGTGQSITETIQNILSVPDNQIGGSLDIFPNPAGSVINIMNTRYPNLVYGFYDVTGKQILSGDLSNSINTINVESFSEGIYFLHLIDEDSGSDITKKIIINR